MLAQPDREIETAIGDVAVTRGGQKGSDVSIKMGPLLSIDDAHGVEASMGLASGARPREVIDGPLAIDRSGTGLHVQNTEVRARGGVTGSAGAAPILFGQPIVFLRRGV